MTHLPPAEARAILDAMGIPVVILRDSSAQPSEASVASEASSDHSPVIESVTVTEPVRVAKPAVVAKSERLDQPVPERPSIELDTPESVSIDAELAAETPCRPFTLISARADHLLVVAELPDWSGGLLDGRLGGVLGDLLQALGCHRETIDWQYFRWPVSGLPEFSREAAKDAVDAWIHRRWGEIPGPDPVMMIHMTELNATDLAPDAVVIPALEPLMLDPAVKRSAWSMLRQYAHST